MSDGFVKRDQHRVYGSPLSLDRVTGPRYEPLASDVEAMRAFELEQRRTVEEAEARAQQALETRINEARSISHVKPDRAARRSDGSTTTTYASAYQPYTFEATVKCPPNEFYKDVEYSTLSSKAKPADLTALQDGWSKTLANRRFHSAYHTRSTDLRLPGGKKKVKFTSAALV